MYDLAKAVAVALLLVLAPASFAAEDIMIETFDSAPQDRWRFFTDGVMGGVSSGRVTFLREEGAVFARMTGLVSTQNNGGFIQMRTDLAERVPDTVRGVRLVARGNDQTYFVHLRTAGTVLPWQYYQARFEVTQEWREVWLPLDSFAPSGRLLRSVPAADSIRSIAIVAYGRDHEALIDLREVGLR